MLAMRVSPQVVLRRARAGKQPGKLGAGGCGAYCGGDCCA